MTNETIRPGDLVMVVRPTICCGNTKTLGKIFIAKKISHVFAFCPYCKFEFGESKIAYCETDGGVSIHRLKKLNPPAKQETTEKEKETA